MKHASRRDPRRAMLLGLSAAVAVGAGAWIATRNQRPFYETLNYEQTPDVVEELKQRTDGRGPDACIDAVGTEAHGTSLDALYDRAKQAVRSATDRSHALRQALLACRKGGTVSIPGVYGGLLDKVPFGAAFAKGLTLRMGETHVHRYLHPLLSHIENGRIDPTFIISHRWPLSRAPEAYRIWNDKSDDCTKFVLDPAR